MKPVMSTKEEEEDDNKTSSSSSSSDDEEENTKKFKEAVWTVSAGKGGTDVTQAGDDKTNKHSKRIDTSKHEHDANELQTTPEFRSHVAKKLGAMLDSFITVVSPPGSSSKPCGNEEEDEGDDGFRLFTKSVPGSWQMNPPSPPRPKRPAAPSSSDSDSEMESRLREAAVSISDLVPAHSQTQKDTTQKDSQPDRVEKQDEGVVKKVKKKKKRKCPTERTEESLKPRNGTHTHTEEEERQQHMKKKKKKKKKEVEEGGSE